MFNTHYKSENVNLHKILYLGLDHKTQVDIQSVGYTVWFDCDSFHAYATIQHRLANAFFTAQLIAKTGYSQPFTIDVFLPTISLGKYKESDPETCIERIYKWLLKMELPSCPIIVKIFTYNTPQKVKSLQPQFGYSDSFNCLWPLIKPNVKQGKYITYQPYENYGGENNAIKDTRGIDGDILQEVIIEEANKLGITILKTDYTVPFDDVIGIISGSLGHFSYFGSSYYIAAALGVHSYIFGYLEPRKRNPIDHIDGSFLPSPWAGNKVTQIDINTMKIYNAPVTNFSFLNTPKDIRNALKSRLKNVTD